MEPTNEFDLTFAEEPVKIDGKPYVLVELNGKQRDVYLTGVGKRVRLGPDGKPAGMNDVNGLEASLITLALFTNDPGAPREPVPANTIQGWPSRVVTALFEKCFAMNKLGKDTPAEKND